MRAPLKAVCRKESFCKYIGSLAAAALKTEAAVTPKPGLGSGKTAEPIGIWTIRCFLASAGALEPYFARCVMLGFERGRACKRLETGCLLSAGGGECDSGLQKLRSAGLAAEDDMYAVTGGVNTHKGVIFSMGILCFCIGQLARRRKYRDCGNSKAFQSRGKTAESAKFSNLREVQMRQRISEDTEAQNAQIAGGAESVGDAGYVGNAEITELAEAAETV